jgi:hypothetical protein
VAERVAERAMGDVEGLMAKSVRGVAAGTAEHLQPAVF